MELTFVCIIRTLCNDNEILCELNYSWHQNLICAYRNDPLCELCMSWDFFKVICGWCNSNEILCEINYSWQALIFLQYGTIIVWATYVVRTSPHYSYIVQQQFFHAIQTYIMWKTLVLTWNPNLSASWRSCCIFYTCTTHFFTSHIVKSGETHLRRWHSSESGHHVVKKGDQLFSCSHKQICVCTSHTHIR